MGKFLEQFKDKFGYYADSYGSGGCETCGYGADQVISDYDYEAMLKEMDEWVTETFGNKENA